jgi:hypothetical protein
MPLWQVFAAVGCVVGTAGILWGLYVTGSVLVALGDLLNGRDKYP